MRRTSSTLTKKLMSSKCVSRLGGTGLDDDTFNFAAIPAVANVTFYVPMGASLRLFVFGCLVRNNTVFVRSVLCCVFVFLWLLCCGGCAASLLCVCLVALLFDCLFTRCCRSHHGTQAGYSPQGLSYY